MKFHQKCKRYCVTPEFMSLFCGVPKRTLSTWHHTKPVLMSRLFDSASRAVSTMSEHDIKLYISLMNEGGLK